MFKKLIAIVILVIFCLTQTGLAMPAQPVHRSKSQNLHRSCVGGNLRQDNDAAAAGGIGEALKLHTDKAKATGDANSNGALTDLTKLLVGTESDFAKLVDAAAGFSEGHVQILCARFNNPGPAKEGLAKEDIQLRILQLLRLVPKGIGDINIDALLDTIIRGGEKIYGEQAAKFAKEIKDERAETSASEEILFEGNVKEAIEWIAKEHGQEKSQVFSSAITALKMDQTPVRIVEGIDSLCRRRGIEQNTALTIDNIIFKLLEPLDLSFILTDIAVPAEADRINIRHANTGIKEVVVVLRLMARFRALEENDRRSVLNALSKAERTIRVASGATIQPLVHLLEEFADEDFYIRLNGAKKYTIDPFIYPDISRALRGLEEADFINQIKSLALEAGGILTQTPQQLKLKELLQELQESETIDGIVEVINHFKEAASPEFTLVRAEKFPATVETWILYISRHGAFGRLAKLGRIERQDLIVAMGKVLPYAATYINSEAWETDYRKVTTALMDPATDEEGRLQLAARERLINDIAQLPFMFNTSLIEDAGEYLKEIGIHPIVAERDRLNGLLRMYINDIAEVDSESAVRNIFSQLLALASLGAELDSMYGEEELNFEIPPTAKYWVMLLMLRGHTHLRGLLDLDDIAKRHLVRLQYLACPIASAIYTHGLWDALFMRQDIPQEKQDLFMVQMSAIPQIQFQLDPLELEKTLVFIMQQLRDYLQNPREIDPEETVNRAGIENLMKELSGNKKTYEDTIFSPNVSEEFTALLDCAAARGAGAAAGTPEQILGFLGKLRHQLDLRTEFSLAITRAAEDAHIETDIKDLRSLLFLRNTAYVERALTIMSSIRDVRDRKNNINKNGLPLNIDEVITDIEAKTDKPFRVINSWRPMILSALSMTGLDGSAARGTGDELKENLDLLEKGMKRLQAEKPNKKLRFWKENVPTWDKVVGEILAFARQLKITPPRPFPTTKEPAKFGYMLDGRVGSSGEVRYLEEYLDSMLKAIKALRPLLPAEQEQTSKQAQITQPAQSETAEEETKQEPNIQIKSIDDLLALVLITEPTTVSCNLPGLTFKNVARNEANSLIFAYDGDFGFKVDIEYVEGEWLTILPAASTARASGEQKKAAQMVVRGLRTRTPAGMSVADLLLGEYLQAVKGLGQYDPLPYELEFVGETINKPVDSATDKKVFSSVDANHIIYIARIAGWMDFEDAFTASKFTKIVLPKRNKTGNIYYVDQSPNGKIKLAMAIFALRMGVPCVIIAADNELKAKIINAADAMPNFDPTSNIVTVGEKGKPAAIQEAIRKVHEFNTSGLSKLIDSLPATMPSLYEIVTKQFGGAISATDIKEKEKMAWQKALDIAGLIQNEEKEMDENKLGAKRKTSYGKGHMGYSKVEITPGERSLLALERADKTFLEQKVPDFHVETRPINNGDSVIYYEGLEKYFNYVHPIYAGPIVSNMTVRQLLLAIENHTVGFKLPFFYRIIRKDPEKPLNPSFSVFRLVEKGRWPEPSYERSGQPLDLDHIIKPGEKLEFVSTTASGTGVASSVGIDKMAEWLIEADTDSAIEYLNYKAEELKTPRERTDYLVLVMEKLAEQLIAGTESEITEKKDNVIKSFGRLKAENELFPDAESQTAIDRIIQRCIGLAGLPSDSRRKILEDLIENREQAHGVAFIGIAVIDYILKRTWEELPEWLRNELPNEIQDAKDGLVVTGDYPGTIDEKGELSQKFLKLGTNGITEDEKDTLDENAIAGGPATSSTRGLEELTRRCSARNNLLFASPGKDELTSKLLDHDLGSSLLHRAKLQLSPSDKRTSVTIGLEDEENRKGNRIFLHDVGANADLTYEKFKQALDEGVFDNAEVIELGGIELSNIMDDLDKVIAAIRDRQNVTRKIFTIVMDTVVDQAHKWKKFSNNADILKEIDILSVSIGEALPIFEDVVGRKPENDAELINFFHDKGIKAVFLKKGTDGSVISIKAGSVFKNDEDYNKTMPILQGLKSESGTGTGDLYVSGIIYGFTHGWSPEKTALCATVMGGICVEHLGGTLGDNGIIDVLLNMQKLKNQPDMENEGITAQTVITESGDRIELYMSRPGIEDQEGKDNYTLTILIPNKDISHNILIGNDEPVRLSIENSGNGIADMLKKDGLTFNNTDIGQTRAAITQLVGKINTPARERFRMFNKLAVKAKTLPDTERVTIDLSLLASDGSVKQMQLILPNTFVKDDYPLLLDHLAALATYYGMLIGASNISCQVTGSEGVLTSEQLIKDIPDRLQKAYRPTDTFASFKKGIKWSTGKLSAGEQEKLYEKTPGTVDYKHGFSVGIDIGAGTGIKIAVLKDGIVTMRKTIELASRAEPVDEIIKNELSEIGEALNLDINAMLEHTTIDVPGLVDSSDGSIVELTNLEQNRPGSVESLSSLGQKYENDANSAAVYHAITENLKGLTVVNTLGGGLGLGVLIDGVPLKGPMEAHFPISFDKNAPLCNCGIRGCVEAMANKAFVIRRAKELAAQKMITLGDIEPKDVGGWLINEINTAFKEIAQQVFSEFGANLMEQYAIISRVLEQNTINVVLVGGISQGESGKQIIQGISQAQQLHYPDLTINVRIGRGEEAQQKDDGEKPISFDKVSSNWHSSVGAALLNLQKQAEKTASAAGAAATGLTDQQIDLLAKNPEAISDKVLRLFYQEDIKLLVRRIVTKYVMEAILYEEGKIVIKDIADKVIALGFDWVSIKEVGKDIDYLVDTRTIRRQLANTTRTRFHINKQAEAYHEAMNATYQELEESILQTRLDIAKNRRDMTLLRKEASYEETAMSALKEARKALEQKLLDIERRLIASVVLRAIESNPYNYLDVDAVKNELESLDVGPWLRTGRADIRKVVGDLMKPDINVLDKKEMQRIEYGKSEEGQFFEEDNPARFAVEKDRIMTNKDIDTKSRAIKGTYTAKRRDALRKINVDGILDASDVEITTKDYLNVASLTAKGKEKLSEYLRQNLSDYVESNDVQNTRSRLEKTGYARDLAIVIKELLSQERIKMLADPQTIHAMLSHNEADVVDIDQPQDGTSATLSARSKDVLEWLKRVKDFTKELNANIKELRQSDISTTPMAPINIKKLALVKRLKRKNDKKTYYAIYDPAKDTTDAAETGNITLNKLRDTIDGILTNLNADYIKARGKQSEVDHEIACWADALRDLLGEDNTGLSENLIISSHRGRVKPQTEEEIKGKEEVDDETLALKRSVTARPLASLQERILLANIRNEAKASGRQEKAAQRAAVVISTDELAWQRSKQYLLAGGFNEFYIRKAESLASAKLVWEELANLGIEPELIKIVDNTRKIAVDFQRVFGDLISVDTFKQDVIPLQGLGYLDERTATAKLDAWLDTQA